jgi:hypothetical protein
MRIDSSGRVGIGTTSPQARLELAQSTDNTDGPKLRIANNANTLSSGQLIGGIDFFDGDDSGEGVGAYIYSYTTDSIGRASGQDLRFGAGESERARIDSSGRLLVGTSTSVDVGGGPAINQLFSNANSNLFALTLGYAAADGPRIQLGKSRNSAYGSRTIVENNDELGTINFNGDDGTDLNTTGASIVAYVDGTPGANDLPSRLVFSTTADGASSPTERMRITSTGAVLVNTTTTATNALFEVSSNGAKKSFQVYNNDNVQLYSLGTGTVYSNGGVLTNTNPSDERLKDSIETLGWGLEEVMALRPVSFDWKNNRTNQGRQYGFIAQEVQSVMPELVTEFETVDGDQTVTRLGLEKDGIYAALVKAIQEQQALITELQNKVAALEAA